MLVDVNRDFMTSSWNVIGSTSFRLKIETRLWALHLKLQYKIEVFSKKVLAKLWNAQQNIRRVHGLDSSGLWPTTSIFLNWLGSRNYIRPLPLEINHKKALWIISSSLLLITIFQCTKIGHYYNSYSKRIKYNFSSVANSPDMATPCKLHNPTIRFEILDGFNACKVVLCLYSTMFYSPIKKNTRTQVVIRVLSKANKKQSKVTTVLFTI